MRILIKKLFVPIAFLLIFCLLYLMVFNVLYVEDPETAAIMRGFYEQKKDALDVVLIGSSSVYAYFSPCQAFHEQGFTSYDLCTAVQPMAAAKYLITEAEKTQHPRLFVINLTSIVAPLNDAVYIRRMTTNMPWSFNRFQMAEGITAYVEPQISRNLADYLLVYPFFHGRWSEVFDPEAKSVNHDPALSDPEPLFFPLKKATEGTKTPYIHRGFNNIWFDAVDWQKQLFYDHDLCRSEAAALPREREALLRDLCEFCKTLDAEVLFLVSPVIYEGDRFAKFNTACTIVEEYGLPVFNANLYVREIGLFDNVDWHERAHVNRYGAEKFTHYLGEYLKDHFDLPDHRGDRAFDEWELEYSKELCETIEGTFLFDHLVDVARLFKLDAEFRFEGALLSERERASLGRIGVQNIPEVCTGIVYIKGGLLSSPEWETDGASDDGRIICSVSDGDGNVLLQESVFKKDPERGLWRNDNLRWSPESRLRDRAVLAADLIEAFELHVQETQLYADCVMAAADEDCAGQTVYVEFQNSDGLFTSYPMHTVERKDWAELLHNSLYEMGGAGVVIPYDELPAGDYSVCLFREKDGMLKYSGTTWQVNVPNLSEAEMEEFGK